MQPLDCTKYMESMASMESAAMDVTGAVDVMGAMDSMGSMQPMDSIDSMDSTESLGSVSEVQKQGVMDMGGYEKLPNTEFSIDKLTVVVEKTFFWIWF